VTADGPVAGRPLSVAVIRARYNPHGGAERFVQRALAALSGRSLALTIIARQWRGGGAGDGLAADVRLARVDPFYLGNVWRDASFARAVTGHLARHRYDLVQSHERIPGVMLYRAGDGVHAEFLAQRRRVLSLRGRLGLALNPHHACTLRAERRMFEHPALRAVICNSEMVREEIASRFGVDRARLVLIRNGVDLERFRPADEDARQRHRRGFGVADGAPVFAFVGSGFERKGLAAALRAMADARAPAAAWLLVAGSDRRSRRYQALAQRLGVGARVRFLGVVADVREVLAAADALLMPTLYDPFPNAVLEALACGVPAITSTKSGAAEVIDAHARNDPLAQPSGFVTDALDIGAIAQAMSAVAAARGGPRHGAMRQAARASVQRYSLAALGDDLIALYERLLDGCTDFP
jgi:UDP-glucose:(heptosyl)LPS alpha-1,3-glucosyltransferase